MAQPEWPKRDKTNKCMICNDLTDWKICDNCYEADSVLPQMNLKALLHYQVLLVKLIDERKNKKTLDLDK